MFRDFIRTLTVKPQSQNPEPPNKSQKISKTVKNKILKLEINTNSPPIRHKGGLSLSTSGLIVSIIMKAVDSNSDGFLGKEEFSSFTRWAQVKTIKSLKVFSILVQYLRTIGIDSSQIWIKIRMEK